MGQILKDKDILLQSFLLEEVDEIVGGCLSVDHEVFQAFCQSDFHSQIVLLVDGLHKLVKLTEVAAASFFELIQNLHELGIRCSDLFCILYLAKLEFFVEELGFDLLDGVLGRLHLHLAFLYRILQFC